MSTGLGSLEVKAILAKWYDALAQGVNAAPGSDSLDDRQRFKHGSGGGATGRLYSRFDESLTYKETDSPTSPNGSPEL